MHIDSEPKQNTINKPIMLGLITALVIGVVAPLVMPHIAHPSMIYHVILHLASITIAIFLSVVSLLAYMRNTTARLFFMMLGFMILAVAEFFYLLDATDALPMLNIPATDIELSHVVLLIMLTMFGLGVLKVNRQ